MNPPIASPLIVAPVETAAVLPSAQIPLRRAPALAIHIASSPHRRLSLRDPESKLRR
jgi:hypothetical protein